MTFPNTANDLLILEASFNRLPEVSAFFYRSDPAKSTRFNFDNFI